MYVRECHSFDTGNGSFISGSDDPSHSGKMTHLVPENDSFSSGKMTHLIRKMTHLIPEK